MPSQSQVPESHLVPLVKFLYCQPNPKFFFNYRDGKFGVFRLNNTPNNERPNDGLASRNHLWSFIVHGNALLKTKGLSMAWGVGTGPITPARRSWPLLGLTGRF